MQVVCRGLLFLGMRLRMQMGMMVVMMMVMMMMRCLRWHA